MAQLSDDCFTHGGRLMTTGEALALLIDRLIPVTEAEPVPLDRALGRVLAEDIVAQNDVPPQDNSAVDGFAVFFDDLNPVGETRLMINGRATAGHPLGRPARRGEAIRIFTGARMPEGPDTVMMQEDCRLEGDVVVIAPGIKRGANRRKRGEDVRSREVVLRQGIRLRPQDVGQAAAVGRDSIVAARSLKVALFSTGDELCEPGTDLAPGCIYDSNRYTVGALLRALGCDVTDFGIVRDRRKEIERALVNAAERNDLIITSGGVSVGEEDRMKPAVEALGKLHVWRLAIKPGRPIAMGQVGRVPLMALPGNPVAVMVTFLNIVRPAVLRLLGCTDLIPHYFQVRAQFEHRKKKNRREWVRAQLVSADEGGWSAVKFPRDGAGILSSMVESDGLIELPEDMTHLVPGTMVDFLPYSEVCS